MSSKWKFSMEPIEEPLCVYDGSQKSIDNCVDVMINDLGLERDANGDVRGEMIMVALWSRILQLQEHADSSLFVHDGGGGDLWSRGEKP